MQDIKNQKRIIGFIGPQGSGKSYQLDILQKKMGWPDINVGRSLRRLDNPGMQAIMSSGELVPDHFVYEIISSEITASTSNTILFDGFFRHDRELEWLLSKIDQFNILSIIILKLDVCPATSLKRIAERVKIAPRKDDMDPEAIKTRLAIYQKNSISVLKMLKSNPALVTIYDIDGEGTPDQVTTEILKALNIQ